MAEKPGGPKPGDEVHFEIIPARRTMRDTGGAIVLIHPTNRLLAERAILISGPPKGTAVFTPSGAGGAWEISLSWTMGASDQTPARIQLVSHDQDRNISDSYIIDEEWIVFPPISVRDWRRPGGKNKPGKKSKAKPAAKKTAKGSK